MSSFPLESSAEAALELTEMREEHEELALVRRLEFVILRFYMVVANVVVAGPHDDLHAVLEIRKCQLHFR